MRGKTEIYIDIGQVTEDLLALETEMAEVDAAHQVTMDELANAGNAKAKEVRELVDLLIVVEDAPASP